MISSHVLDLALGAPARALTLHLDVLEADGRWRALAVAVTDDDGRAADLANAAALAGRTCRLSFETEGYFAATNRATIFPRVEVIFVVAKDAARHHVPLLLSPFGYTVYRGS
jgi:5-hydroxyisourate hydrolase